MRAEHDEDLGSDADPRLYPIEQEHDQDHEQELGTAALRAGMPALPPPRCGDLPGRIAVDPALQASIKVNPPEDARLTFDPIVHDKLQESAMA
jgi:hypothetical protein